MKGRWTETPEGTSDGRVVKFVLHGLVRQLGKKDTASPAHADPQTAVWIAVWRRPGYCSGALSWLLLRHALFALPFVPCKPALRPCPRRIQKRKALKQLFKKMCLRPCCRIGHVIQQARRHWSCDPLNKIHKIFAEVIVWAIVPSHVLGPA